MRIRPFVLICLLAVIALNPLVGYAQQEVLQPDIHIDETCSHVVDEDEFTNLEFEQLGTYALNQELILQRQNEIALISPTQSEESLATATNKTEASTDTAIAAITSVDLDVRDFTSSLGSTFVCRQNVTFTVMVINWGPGSTRARMALYMNDVMIGQGLTSSLGPYTYTMFQASLNINTAALHNARFSAFPEDTINFFDPNIENNSDGMAITTTMDTDLFPGKWVNARNLTVNIDSAAAAMFNNNTAFTDAVHQWNWLSTNVRFSAQMSSGTNCLVWTTASSHINSSVVAWTQLFRDDGTPIPDTLVLYDGSYYGMATVTINSTGYEWPSLPLAKRTGTIIHEFGHVLGLMHPHNQPTLTNTMCNNPSVMWYYSTGPRTEYITPHDSFNVRAKYGY